MTGAASERALALHLDAHVMAEPDRNLVLDPVGQVVERSLVRQCEVDPIPGTISVSLNWWPTSGALSEPTTRTPAHSSGPKAVSTKNGSSHILRFSEFWLLGGGASACWAIDMGLGDWAAKTYLVARAIKGQGSHWTALESGPLSGQSWNNMFCDIERIDPTRCYPGLSHLVVGTDASAFLYIELEPELSRHSEQLLPNQPTGTMRLRPQEIRCPSPLPLLERFLDQRTRISPVVSQCGGRRVRAGYKIYSVT